jgi:hypothetical protein
LIEFGDDNWKYPEKCNIDRIKSELGSFKRDVIEMKRNLLRNQCGL